MKLEDLIAGVVQETEAEVAEKVASASAETEVVTSSAPKTDEEYLKLASSLDSGGQDKSTHRVALEKMAEYVIMDSFFKDLARKQA